ncbi:MAG: 1-acyl-sn-glycerol-3-phosphate acyltransferase [Clostridiales bacterium]|nr:1-acyl-sn-glycerol-3-phosphate acyltransferase [Clostridiales bacterium]
MIVYRLGVFLARIWLILSGCRIIGKENIPASGPLLVIANHTSFADPVLLAAAFPQHITFIAKEEFYRQSFTKWLFGLLGAVFLNKEESDLSALRSSMKLLKEGRIVAIFPEGRRNRDQVISEFMSGAGYIALKTGVPVLPVAISNSKDMWLFWKRNIVVNIGRLLTPQAAGKIDQQQLSALTMEFRQKVTDLYIINTSLSKKNH